MGWAVRTQDLDRIAKRLDLTPDEGSRAGRDGALIRWRMAGVQQAAAEPLLPFFIEWGQDTRLPGRAQDSHPAAAVSIEKVLVRGNEQRMDAWLGGDTLPLEVTAGAPAVVGLVLSVAGGAIHVGPDPVTLAAHSGNGLQVIGHFIDRLAGVDLRGRTRAQQRLDNLSVAENGRALGVGLAIVVRPPGDHAFDQHIHRHAHSTIALNRG